MKANPHKNSVRFALLALILITAPTAPAVPLLYSLNGVIFNDGATAIGYFVYDPATQIFGPYDITTSTGSTGLIGSHYSYFAGTGYYYQFDTGFAFGNPSAGSMFFDSQTFAGAPGLYPLIPGTLNGDDHYSFGDSGEFTPDPVFGVTPRVVTTGSFAVVFLPDNGSTFAFLGCSVLLLLFLRRIFRRLA